MKSALKRFIWVAVSLLIAAAGYLSYARWIKKDPLPEGLIQANGRVEGDHVAVSSKFSGRIRHLYAREGDEIDKNQMLIQMDDPQVRAGVRQAEYAVGVLEAQIKATKTSLDVLRQDVPLSIKIAEDGVAHARTMAAEAKAIEQQKKREAIRYRDLCCQHAASVQATERAELAYKIAQQELDSSLYILNTAGLGLFVATIARNLAQAGMLTVLIVSPMIFLSGAWTPPEAMAPWMRFIMYISPLHYYIDSSLGILLKGAGLDILWDSVLIMSLLGGAVFALGMWRFRRQFD